MTAREGLFKAAGIIAAVSVISKFLGFAREASLAAVFGATYATDAYLVGQTIPTLVFAAVGAALGNTFIPVFSQVRQDRGREAAFRTASSVINATGLLALVFITAGEFLADPLTRIVAPGFHGPAYILTVRVTCIMFPMILFQALSGLMTGMLQADDDFATPAFAGLAFNAVIIASILCLGPRFGIGAVAAGTVAAIAAQALLQAPALSRSGYCWQPILDLRDPGLRRIGVLVGPVLVATTVGQVGTLVERMLASRLAEGSVSALNYANRLMGLVPGVFGLAITTVMYPTLARLAAARDWPRYSKAFAEAVKMINFILVPVAVGMSVLRVPLVRLVFERGAFDADATRATAWALLFFCPGVAVLTLRDMVNRAFFAFQDTTAPMIIGLLGTGVSVALNFVLVGPLQHGGLALAASLSAALGAAALLCTLRARVRALSATRHVRHRSAARCAAQPERGTLSDLAGGDAPPPDRTSVVGIGGRAILSSFWRVAVASAIMGALASLTYSALESCLPAGAVLTQAIRLFGAVGAGVLSYTALVWFLRVPEAHLVLDVVRRAWQGGSMMRRRRISNGGLEQ